MPLLPGMLLGEPPLELAPLPPEPLRLVPLEVPEAPLDPAGPQSIALLLLPLLERLPLLPPEDDVELPLGRLALLPLESIELLLLGEFIAVLPGGHSEALVLERLLGLELPLELLGLELLGLEALGELPLAPEEPVPLCWASAVPPNRTTAAAAASRPCL